MVGDFPVADKIVAVTGGGSGISFEFVRLAHAVGAKVLIADLRLTPAAEEFVKSQVNVHFLKCDVRNWKELDAIVQTSEELWQDVPDVYIAGAGIFEPKWSNFWDDTEDTDYASVSINVNHPIKLTRIAIRALLSKGKKGVVCIISSIAGIQGAYPVPLYCATKHAIVGFVKSMGQCEKLEGIKITSILPCVVETPLWTPDKMSQYTFANTETVSAAEVGKEMLSLVQDGKYEGGTILEINPIGTRVIPPWNVEPPPSRLTGIVDQAGVERSLAPVKAALNKDRKQSKLP